MTKKNIDYSNCIIYKLCCNDHNIKEIYIGSTTNFRARKSKHKSDCNNINSRAYNFYLYEFIRMNGGFDNWSMIMIETLQCKDSNDLHKRERYHLENLKASLNNNIPSRSKPEYCKIRYSENKETHLQYMKQYRIQNKERESTRQKIYYKNNRDRIIEKQKNKINCECGKSYTYVNKLRHLKTSKHLKFINNVQNEIIV